MKTKDLTRMALLTAIALTIFMVELQLPGLSPVPGIKLGLSNIVTVWAVFTMGPKKAAMILAARVFLGAVFSGQMSTILYSGAGGVCAIAITILSRKILTSKVGMAGIQAQCVIICAGAVQQRQHIFCGGEEEGRIAFLLITAKIKGVFQQTGHAEAVQYRRQLTKPPDVVCHDSIMGFTVGNPAFIKDRMED